MQWPAISSEDMAEAPPPRREKTVPFASAKKPQTPIDFSRIVLDVLRSFGGPGGVSFQRDVPSGAAAGLPDGCALREGRPAPVLLACVRSRPSRACVLFTPEGVELHRCEVDRPHSLTAIPYSEFPARRFTFGRGVTEADLGRRQVFDVSGGSVPAATLIGVLRRISNAIVDEQKARGEYVARLWAPLLTRPGRGLNTSAVSTAAASGASSANDRRRRATGPMPRTLKPEEDR